MSDHELVDLPYAYDALAPFISKQVMEWHHDVHHAGYVSGLNSAEEGLEAQRESGDFSDTGALLSSFTHNFCGDYLHAVFWDSMAADGGGLPEGELRDQIEEDFGSLEDWRAEFRAAAKAASGWALLVWVPRLGQLHNVAVDRHDEGAVWGAEPVLALDVWEHSYYHDYGPDRGGFIEGFMDHIDWPAVADRFDAVR